MMAGGARNKEGQGKGWRPFVAGKSVSWVLKVVLACLVFPAVVGVSVGGFLAFARTVPSVVELKQTASPSTIIYADDGTLLGEVSLRKGKHVPFEQIPPDIINAVTAVEDSHFWTHSGVDYRAIMRAALTDLLKRELKEGGSTITQQLAKITFLTPQKTFRRKLREFILARRIEKNLSKKEILELYLNRVYFGHGAYGVETAARTYFGKSVGDITLREAAMLAGLLKAPAAYSPFADFQKAKRRQVTVLKRMEEVGFLTRKERMKAQKTPISLVRPRPSEMMHKYFLEYIKQYLQEKYGAEALYKGGLRVHTTLDVKAQAAAQKALRKGLRELDKRQGFRGPLDHRNLEEEPAEEKTSAFKLVPPERGDILQGVVLSVTGDEAVVRTRFITGTLALKDARWARTVRKPGSGKATVLRNFTLKSILQPGDVILVGVKSMKGERVHFSLEQEPQVQGAVVALEPYSGYIRAMVGGYDFTKSEFNRAVYAERQVGSAFKPVVYALALQSGFTPASVIVDEEISFDDEEADEELKEQTQETMKDAASKEGQELEVWVPRNYDEKYHGPTRLRDALAYSRNVVTVKLADAIGITRLINFARQVGIKSHMQRDLTIALGSMSITPLELTSAYGSFANSGVKMQPIAIKYITDKKGRVLESNEPQGRRVMDRQTAFLMTSMLEDVVNYGTGWRARSLGVPVAGKTGTTNEYRDAWFLGYTTQMVAGVWVGFDEPHSLGKDETGSRAAAPIWVDFMHASTPRSRTEDFPIPPGIVTRLIDPETGLLANRWTEKPLREYFKKGTEPTKHAPSIWQWQEPSFF
ncbi:MAG: PBP1A family penicillin-binding protein [Nitrospirota bacterium]